MNRVDSKSHHVFVGAEAVVKFIAAEYHAWLDRGVTLAAKLPPAGITVPVLAHGRIATEGGDMRYACMARQPGASPGMELDVDRDTAVGWARQAAHRLQRLHDWSPGSAASALRTRPRRIRHASAIMNLIGRVGEANAVLSQPTMDGLCDIADPAPERASTTVQPAEHDKGDVRRHLVSVRVQSAARPDDL